MVKKISAIFLALVLCLTALIVPVSASVELGDAQIAFSLEWDKDYYEAGDTAILSVYMDAADDLSLYTGSFLIGLNSTVFSQTDNSQADVRANSTVSDKFGSYWKDGSANISWLASTVAPKVTAACTVEENELYDHYLKFTAARNSSGSHENVANSYAGFGGDEFDPTEPIMTISLVVGDVPDGTVVNAAIVSGGLTSNPVQTSWKYFTGAGANKTGTVAAADFDVKNVVVNFSAESLLGGDPVNGKQTLKADIVGYAVKVCEDYEHGTEEATLIVNMMEYKYAVAMAVAAYAGVDPAEYEAPEVVQNFLDAHADCDCLEVETYVPDEDSYLDDLVEAGITAATFTMDEVGAISLVFESENTELDILVYYNIAAVRVRSVKAEYNAEAGCYITEGIPAAYIDELFTIQVGDAEGFYSLATYIAAAEDDITWFVADALAQYAAAAEAYKNVLKSEVE